MRNSDQIIFKTHLLLFMLYKEDYVQIDIAAHLMIQTVKNVKNDEEIIARQVFKCCDCDYFHNIEKQSIKVLIR